MKIYLKIITLLSFVVITISYTAAEVPLEMSNLEIHQLIIKESDQIINSSKILSNLEKSLLLKTRDRVFAIIKNNNPIHHVKEIVLKYGTGAGLTAAITEFTTIILLPKVFYSAGLDALAAISIATPSFAITVPMFIMYSKYREKKKIFQELELTSEAKVLEKIRKDILLFKAEERTASFIINEEHLHKQIHVIQTLFAKQRYAIDHYIKHNQSIFARLLKSILPIMTKKYSHLIEVFELEEIATKHYNKHYVWMLKQASLKHPAIEKSLYTQLLLDIIFKSKKAKEKLISLLMAKSQLKNGNLDSINFTKLILIHEKMATLSSHRTKLTEIKKKWLKSFFYNNSSFTEQRLIHQYFNDLIQNTVEIEQEIVKSEYLFLQEYNNSPTDFNYSYPYTKHSEKISELKKEVFLLNKGLDTNFPNLLSYMKNKNIEVPQTKGQKCLQLFNGLFLK